MIDECLCMHLLAHLKQRRFQLKLPPNHQPPLFKFAPHAQCGFTVVGELLQKWLVKMVVDMLPTVIHACRGQSTFAVGA